MAEIDLSIILVGILAGGLARSMPFLFAALGEIFSERAGVLNLANEGSMLSGSLFGFLGAYFTGSLWVGIVTGLLGGLLIGIFLAIFTISFRLNQIISGTVFWLVALGLTSTLFRMIFGVEGYPVSSTFEKVNIPFLSDIPYLGRIIFQQNPLVYLGLVLVPITAFILFRTTLGVKITAVGENPRAADSMGVNVYRIRYICVFVSALLAGLGGAYLSLAQISSFRENMTLGRGWIAIAIVQMAGWNPYFALLGSLVFGIVTSTVEFLNIINIGFPPRLLLTLPYLLVIVLMIARRKRLPSAMTIPYKR